MLDRRPPAFFSFRSSFLTTYTKHNIHTHYIIARETALLGEGGRGTTDPGNFEKRDTNNNHHTTTAFTGGARPGTHFGAAAAGIFVLFILLMGTKTHRRRRRQTRPLGFRSIRFDSTLAADTAPTPRLDREMTEGGSHVFRLPNLFPFRFLLSLLLMHAGHFGWGWWWWSQGRRREWSNIGHAARKRREWALYMGRWGDAGMYGYVGGFGEVVQLRGLRLGG